VVDAGGWARVGRGYNGRRDGDRGRRRWSGWEAGAGAEGDRHGWVGSRRSPAPAAADAGLLWDSTPPAPEGGEGAGQRGSYVKDQMATREGGSE
jgi:hypothetical protein